MTDQIDLTSDLIGPNLTGEEGEPARIQSSSPAFGDVLARRFGRRAFIGGAAALAAAGPLTGFLAPRDAQAGEPLPALNFRAVPNSSADRIVVAEGYTATPFIPWGTPLTGNYPAYKDGGLNTGEEQEQQVGMHHDGMHFFPLKAGASDHGLLCVNHEYIDQRVLLPHGPTYENGVRTVEDELRKELAAHGVSVIEIRRDAKGGWSLERSRYNRRITAATPMELTGPVRGSDHVKTRYSPDGTKARGTIANCSRGYTPWNSYLTCEENWSGYFFSTDEDMPREHTRYGVLKERGRYGWGTYSGVDVYDRFNASTRGATAAEDYRNEPNTFGWVVEIDPFDPTSTPLKRTALGRFAHECVAIPDAVAGQPIVAYMADDTQFEYLYKFVSARPFDPQGDNRDLLEDGRLYAARFNADGSGEWLALVFGENGLTPQNGFADQADVLVNTRLAADFVGATPMDRPEWVTIHPATGTVYATLTNNTARDTPNAANPRAANPYGHIIRWDETGAHHTGEAFTWDIFVLAGPENDSRVMTADGPRPLTKDNMFSSPDGLWFDAAGILWIETDGNETGGHDALLAAEPLSGEIRRFLTGVAGCEMTGLAGTPDRRTLFCNVQHPGNNDPAGSSFPDGPGRRPRSTTLVVARNDGGTVGTDRRDVKPAS